MKSVTPSKPVKRAELSKPWQANSTTASAAAGNQLKPSSVSGTFKFSATNKTGENEWR